ncbi:UNVERIFIED_CONTAM: hypothetical protein K2H54_064932 [Gekko kuhli]
MLSLFPAIVDCCTEVAHRIPRRLLRTVVKFKIQKDEVCKIPAVILYTKKKKLCQLEQTPFTQRSTICLPREEAESSVCGGLYSATAHMPTCGSEEKNIIEH